MVGKLKQLVHRVTKFIQQNANRPLFVLVTSIFLGSIIFIVLFTATPVDTSNVEWMFVRGGDSFQHQIGWMAFRSEPWQIKIGTISSLLYPTGTSITYTDSIPLLAVFFKLFNPILPNQFQYFGLWTLLCWILTIYFALLIFSSLNLSWPIQYLGAILFAISPTMIDRVFHHDALVAQWLILAAIWLLIKQIQGKNGINAWPFLLAAGLWIHAYLFVMVGAFYASALMLELVVNRSWKRVALNVGISLVLCAMSGYALGMFDSPSQVRTKNIAHYSANLNAFINPLDSSAFLEKQPIAFEGQYEGYAYLGIGGLVLLALTVITINRSLVDRKNLPYLALVVPTVLLAAFSSGGTITAGETVLWKIPIPGLLTDLYQILRSNGRFIWPLFYLLLIFLVARFDQKRCPWWVLVGIILIQYVDISPLVRAKQYTALTTYQSPLSSDFWKTADQKYKHVFMFPEEDTRLIYPPYALYAVQHHMTINWVYLARADYRYLDRLYEDVKQDLYMGKMDGDTIYIATDKRIPNTISREGLMGVIVCREGDHWIIVKDETMPIDVKSSFCKIANHDSN